MDIAYKKQVAQQYENLIESVTQMQDRVYLDMETVYADWIHLVTDEYAMGNKGALKLIVRKAASGTPEAKWAWSKRVVTLSGSKMHFEDIRISKARTYPMTKFRKAAEWERSLVTVIEPVLTSLRREYIKLSDCKRHLRVAKANHESMTTGM